MFFEGFYMSAAISAFKTVRDMPYRIPLALDEEDSCCNGKHRILKNLLIEQGFKVRYRICTFRWSSINLPEKVSNVPHDDNCAHLYLEVMINGRWVIVDATWDGGLKDIFHINEWDGKQNTEIAVKSISIFSPKESAEIMKNDDEEEILSDLQINVEFYRAFNRWLEENRIVYD
jgi:hypothetical protein